MFDVGSLAASLRIEGMAQFEGDLQRAGDALDRTGQKGASFGSLGEAAVRKAAGATVALTGAAGAYLTILTRTGVSYNSLQQNSRAALSTLLGGAEAANAQMAKLDDFASNSPFSKDVFIGAQQQLISFGVETEKVIPYLDALQNAVASAGGSNADLEAVVATMAKIQSSSKITAQDLNEFGNRGINAAELIGESMGKTGAEIREEITAGSLDATEALDALAQGMTDRFGGATDLVKQQWSGATDRIKAAQRDLGATLAEPFVSAQGGGMAVTWANQVADILRAIGSQAVPLMEILTTRGAGVFAGITAGLDDARRAIANWDISKVEQSLDTIGRYGPAIGTVAGALGAMATSAGPLSGIFGTLGMSINPLLGAFIGLAASSPEVRQGISEVVEAAKPLGSVLGDVAKIMAGQLTSVLPLVSDGLGLVADILTPLVSLIEAIPTPLLTGALAFLALHQGLKLVKGPLGSVLTAFQQFGQKAAIQATLGNTNTLMGGLATASIGARTGVANLGTALKTAFLSNPVGIAITAISTAVGAWAIANANAEQKVQEHNDRVAQLRGTLDEATGSLTEATRAQVAHNLSEEEAFDLASKVGVSHKDLTDAIMGNEDAYKRVTAAMDKHSEATTLGDANLDTWSSTATDAKMNIKDLTAILEEQSAAVVDAQAKQRELNAAVADSRSSMSDAGRATADYNAASAIAGDTTKALEDRIRSLKTMYDLLTGGASSAAEAQAQVDASNLVLSEGFAKVDEQGQKMWAGAISMAAETTNYIDTSTRAGQDLFNALKMQQTSTLQASIVARDTAINNGESASEAFAAARSAAEEYNTGLSETLQAAGITGEAHDNLMAKWAIDPDVAAFTVTDNGTMDALTLQAMQLAIQIESTPDKTVTIDEPESPEIIKRLEELGYTIKELPDSKIQISSEGETTVRDTLNELTQPRNVSIFLNPFRTGSDADWHPPMLAPSGGGLSGNLYSGGVAQTFATGGFSSGFYKAPPGQDSIHKFAERELAWEAYISPKPGFEAKNIKIAMEALDRLNYPVVPASALKGIPGFASGKMVDMRPQAAAPGVSPRYSVTRKTTQRGPLANVINIGVESSHNDLLNLSEVMDRVERGG